MSARNCKLEFVGNTTGQHVQRLIAIIAGVILIGVAAYLYVATSESLDASNIDRAAEGVSPLPAQEGRIFEPSSAASNSGSTSTAAAPVTQPHRQFTVNVGWARLDKSVPLSTVFSASRNQSELDERAAATHLAAKCLSITLAPPTAESIRGVAGSSERLLTKVRESVSQLQSYCSEGNVDDFLKEQQSAKRSSGTLYKAMTALKASEKRTPEYLQAATQVLSNPEKYSVQFDMWLSSNLEGSLLLGKNFSSAQVAFIQDELFNRLANASTGPNSIRGLIRCAEQYVCPGADNFPESERQAALHVTAIIEQQIRTQRWDLLIR